MCSTSNVEGTLEDNFDIIPAFGNLSAGMKQYLVTSDGMINIVFSNVVQNPLVNAIEVVAADSNPGVLGIDPIAVDFGATQINGTQSRKVTLSNLGTSVGDPTITVSAVAPSGGQFTTNFVAPVSLLPGQSTQFDVTFAPTSGGAQAGSLAITHSGTNSPRFIALDGLGSNDVPVSFSASGLTGENLNNPTSLQFGPDGRLYVSQQDGEIKAYTVTRNGPNDYVVTATESIIAVKVGTPNHNDDGSFNSSTVRQVTGLLVTGTATNPVLFVSSSDSRISVGTDSGLDTNSGVISRLTWTGTTWDKVDLVRGLPRSEENHSTNGMDLDEATNTLYVMSGGHANKGAPGNNFSGTPEYYLSAALLSVDLDEINALPVLTDPRYGNKFVYDLRTLDDPTRPNIDKTDPTFPYPAGHPLRDVEIDPGDPFGGHNSLNQAIPEPGGPVQIYSPGYRNAYDVVLTENGRLYSVDNGPNGGWGGQPLVYAAGSTPGWSATPADPADAPKGPDGTGPFDQAAGDFCTNEFNETSSNKHGDPLHFIEGPGYYGGHPTPIRAFPDRSGVIEYQNLGGWVAVHKYNFYDLLPAGLSPADFPADPIQCSYSANNPAKYLDIVNASTNGITEYTATNFGGKLQGNILAASFDGSIYSYKLNAAGDSVIQKTALFSGFGSQPLDVVAQGDDGPFPGTVWAATYGAKNITVFEPSDASLCTGANDPTLDEDGDGYSNADEISAGTNPCSGGDKPSDNDGDNQSDVSDPDDDNDGIGDAIDEFAARSGERFDDEHPGVASAGEQRSGNVPLRSRAQRSDDERVDELRRPVRSRQPGRRWQRWGTRRRETSVPAMLSGRPTASRRPSSTGSTLTRARHRSWQPPRSGRRSSAWFRLAISRWDSRSGRATRTTISS